MTEDMHWPSTQHLSFVLLRQLLQAVPTPPCEGDVPAETGTRQKRFDCNNVKLFRLRVMSGRPYCTEGQVEIK